MIAHWYHVYADGTWQEPVTEHLTALEDSGLANALDHLTVGIVGSPENREAVKATIGLEADWVEADTGWEHVTLEPLHAWAKTTTGVVLYAHSKSAHDPSPINRAWRTSMCYWNVIRWRDQTARLDTHDTAGCHWITDPEHRFYGGNYWWATTAYLSRLPALEHRDRWCAEWWIGEAHPIAHDANPGWPAHERFTTRW